jgi:archaellum biogenesis protein FlaJ (TadC family)
VEKPLSDNRHRQVARQTWIAFLIVEVVAVIITVCALADVLFGLGWGYNWTAVLMGAGLCVWGVIVWVVCRAVFRRFNVEP